MALQLALQALHALHSWLSELRWYVAPSQPVYVASIHGGQPSDPELPDKQLSWQNVGIAAMLLGFNVVLSMWLGLGLGRSLIVAAGRCVVQLTLLGMVLKQIFLTQNPIYIFGMTLVLGTLAAFEVTYWRSKRRFPGMYLGTLLSIMGSALIVALFGNAYSLNMDPAYTATKFIPTIGMLFGNCMIGVSIGMGSLMDSLDTHRDRVETMLCYGATRWEVTRPVVVDALRTALLPTITNMSITGLISIPGVMTGWILGGADVLQAARYQQIILFMISASTASSTLLSVLFCAFVLVDGTPMLRLDRLVVAGKLANLATAKRSESGKLSSVSSRLALRRSGCRPKSDLYSSRNTSTGSSSPCASKADTLKAPDSLAMLQSRLSGLQLQQRRSSYGDKDDEEEFCVAVNRLTRQSSRRPSLNTPLLQGARKGSAGRASTRSALNQYEHVDIEDAAARCRERCGHAKGLWSEQNKSSKQRHEQESEDTVGEPWKSKWCACCPYRSIGESAQGGGEGPPIVCYEFAGDPTDIVIPHPPGLVCVIPGASSSSAKNPEEAGSGDKPRCPRNVGRKVKHFGKRNSRQQQPPTPKEVQEEAQTDATEQQRQRQRQHSQPDRSPH